ncbi:MAG: alanine racemase [Oligoflexales bacterium]|nr:alanine racemase [Oligoflexales bacterium]
MHSWINLSAEALRANYRIFSKLAENSILMPVIKSNAYGHGLKEIHQILKSENPPYLATNYLYEARELREYGYEGNIIVVGPIFPEELKLAREIRAEILLGNGMMLDAWILCKDKPDVHVKIDTGMNRQGFYPDAFTQVIKTILPFKNSVKGICTHFANVEDVLEHEYAEKQMELFNAAVKEMEKAGIKCIKHMASSASTLILDKSRRDLVRVGISIYGLWPSQATRLSYLNVYKSTANLKPVLEWKTKVASIKTVPNGQFIGYGCTYKTTGNTLLAVIPVGYYEGYPRIAGNQKSYVLIKGNRCPIIGRICMNMMMVDISHVQGISPMDTVTLIGRDGEEYLDPGLVASWAGTIHYELLTCLNPKIPRYIV